MMVRRILRRWSRRRVVVLEAWLRERVEVGGTRVDEIEKDGEGGVVCRDV